VTPGRWAAAAGARALVIVDDFDPTESDRRVDGPDGHHLARVRRLEIDERLVVADGAGHWYEAQVVANERDALVVVRAGESFTEPVPMPSIAVAFAPAKRDRGAEVTHQLVELGVDRIIPLVSRRGVVRWDDDRTEAALDRLRRIAREAAMQSHRARLPKIEPLTSVIELATTPGLVVADRVEAQPGRAFDPAGVADASRPEYVVLVGPEGGFAEDERVRLATVPRLTVGAHVLRSVTAPIAAAAVLVAHRS